MRSDIVERMQAQQAAFDQGLHAFGTRIMAAIQNIAKSPPSAGYEPWLVKHGCDRILARGQALLLVHRANRMANDNLRLTAVVAALRYLAKPRRNRPAILRRIAVLLAAWKETSIIETVFYKAKIDDFAFVRALELAATGDRTAYLRVTEIAASIVPHLPSAQGRKLSAASAAHEFFLESVVPTMNPGGPQAFSWNDLEERCTDAMTQATIDEFALPGFDPRPAYRRLRTRRRA